MLYPITSLFAAWHYQNCGAGDIRLLMEAAKQRRIQYATKFENGEVPPSVREAIGSVRIK